MEIKEIYLRFKSNYKRNGAICIYPQFDDDLKKLLKFIEEHMKG